MNDNTNISIIGSGITGLMAAHNLRSSGYAGAISINDAAPTSGGRLSSQKLGQDSFVMEFGAGRLHKQQHNRLYRLCQQLGLELSPFDYKVQTRTDSDAAELRGVLALLENAAPAYAGQGMHFADFCSHVFDRQTTQQLQTLSGYDALLNPFLPIEAGLVILTHHPETQSLLYGKADDWFCIKEGFQELTNALESKLQSSVNFCYQTKLTSISDLEADDSGYRLAFETPNDDLSVIADAVIFAIPPQALQAVQKRKEIAPIPALQKIETIPLAKGFFQFNHPWWKQDEPGNACIIADTPFRKLYLPQDSNSMWFYCDSDSALKAKALLENQSEFPREWIEQHLGQAMPDDASLIGSGWKFWEQGISFIKNPASHPHKGFLEVAKNLLFCSDIFTDHMGWLEGNLISADAAATYLHARPERPKLVAVTPTASTPSAFNRLASG